MTHVYIPHVLSVSNLILPTNLYVHGRNVLTGNNPENVSNVQKTNSKSYKQDQEGRAEVLC